jgi:hypothetical protein
MMKITQSRDLDSCDHMHKSIWRGTILRVFAIFALQAFHGLLPAAEKKVHHPAAGHHHRGLPQELIRRLPR